MRNLSKDIKAHRPILIQPTVAASFLERAASVAIPLGSKASELSEMLEAMFGAVGVLEKFPPYAVIPVRGVIGKNLSELDKMCGCCDIHDVEEMLEDCVRDESVKVIILDVDSPGGTSVGVPELAKRVRECPKRVIAFTSNECCSAAYWIASQASEFYATPSSSVGSIGCYIAYNDMSKAFADEGVTVDVIRSGKVKGAGIPGTSLTAEQRKMLLDEVVEIHEDFKADVKSVREFVSDDSMEGQTFSGKKAAEAGLVTSLVNGFDEMMEAMDAEVAAQMEADEENDERSEGAEDDEDDEAEMSASVRALRGLKPSAFKPLKPASMKVVITDDDGEDEKDEEGKTPSEEEKDSTPPQPSSEMDDDKKDGENDDGEDAKSEADTDADEAGEGEDSEAKSEEEGDDDEEDGDDDKPSTEPTVEESEEGKKDAEEESDTGDKAVDMDDDPDKDGMKRNKSRGVA